jgi:MOSC domain-containing protein YiiM
VTHEASARLDALLVGEVRPLGSVESAIHKSPVEGPTRLEVDGLVADTQADRRVHGGIEKAVHHYPRDHYAAWRADLGDHPLLEAPGAFGENLSTLGIVEADVCLGDEWRLGGARLQVSQGRQPCFKLALRFGRKDMPRLLQASGRTGWYYRVLECGDVRVGDVLELAARPHPEWPLTRATRVLYERMLDHGELRAMASLPSLAESWRTLAERRLARGVVEDWTRRLEGPESA